MITKFNVGDEVYVRAVIKGIEVDEDGTQYRILLPNLDPTYIPKMTVREDVIISAEVEDFRRENPSEKD